MTETLHRQVERLINAIDEAEELHGGLLSREVLRIASETRIALAAAMRERRMAQTAFQAAIESNRQQYEA